MQNEKPLTVGVIGTYNKKAERRVPIHPDHLPRLPDSVKRQLIFEEGYGAPFDMADAAMAAQAGGVATRSEILAKTDVVVLAKPVVADLVELREAGVLWGYPHCVQQREMTQTAIDRKQTLIAFEDMFVWGPNGERGLHTFYKNNELAGYCGVLHALQLKGISGHYGKQRKVTILSFGAVSRGAIYALQGLGFRDITVCIQRPEYAVRGEILNCNYIRMKRGGEGQPRMIVVEEDGTIRAMSDLINESDIIINGTFQKPSNPLNFVTEEEAGCLKQGSLIIDVSCDEGMGFFFAKPTTFENPMFKAAGVDYYAVDHTPSYLWKSASRAISAALIPYLPTIIGGPDRWHANETIRKAINIEAGVIQIPTILAFQNREADYPHACK